MSDTREHDIEDTGDDDTEDDEPIVDRVPLADLGLASSILRLTAILSLVVWVVALVSSAWFQWSQLGSFAQSGGPERSPRLLGTLAAATTSTWGYLLVAVVSYTALLLVQRPTR